MNKQNLIDAIAEATGESKSSLKKIGVEDLQSRYDALESSDEDLLGEVETQEDSEEEIPDASLEGFTVTETPATEVEVGQTVVSGRRGHKPVEVAKIRLGRKHVTLFDDQDRDVVWVPLAGGTVQVLTEA